MAINFIPVSVSSYPPPNHRKKEETSDAAFVNSFTYAVLATLHSEHSIRILSIFEFHSHVIIVPILDRWHAFACDSPMLP